MITVNYDWYDEEHTILLISVDPHGWTWDDAYRVIKQQVVMMETVSHTVHTIFHFKTPPRLPNSPNIFTNIRNLMNTRADNEGLSIFIGTNRLFESFITTAGRVSQLRWLIDKYRYVMSIEQALSEINAYEQQTQTV